MEEKEDLSNRNVANAELIGEIQNVVDIMLDDIKGKSDKKWQKYRRSVRLIGYWQKGRMERRSSDTVYRWGSTSSQNS